MRRIAVTLLVLALLTATAAAFVLAEALKLEGPAIAAPRVTEAFAPGGECRPVKATFAFGLRRSNRIDAVVVDAQGSPVRTLATDERHRRGRVRLTWDGTRDDGTRAPDGEYRLRLHLSREDRTVTIPSSVRLDSALAAPPCRAADA